MPTFITLSILLSYLVQTKSNYQFFFTSSLIIYLGLLGLVISVTGAVIKKKFYPAWYDLFATAALLIWFSYWHQFFRTDAPMFYLYPLYFAFFAAIVSLLFINNRHRLDHESIHHLKNFDQMVTFHPGLVISGVLLSLLLPTHYLLFPIAISLFIIRYTIHCCADIQ